MVITPLAALAALAEGVAQNILTNMEEQAPRGRETMEGEVMLLIEAEAEVALEQSEQMEITAVLAALD